MKVEQKTMYQCEICGKMYDTESKALECEALGRKFQELKEMVKPYMWYEFLYGLEKVKLTFIDKVKVNYHGWIKPCCFQNEINIFSTYYNNYFDLKVNNFIAMYTIEEAYIKYGILPKFGSSNFDYIQDKEVALRISTLYDKRNNELKKRIDDMSIEEIKDRLYNSYKFEPNRYRIHQDDNLEESCYLFYSNHPEIM